MMFFHLYIKYSGMQRMGTKQSTIPLKSSGSKEVPSMTRLSEPNTIKGNGKIEINARNKKSENMEHSPELIRVLRYIGSLLENYNQPFEARRLGFAVMGMSGLSSEIKEVRNLVDIVAARAKNAWGEINSQELSMCLHGTWFVYLLFNARLFNRTYILDSTYF